MHDHRPQVPPQRVWVREPQVRGEAMGFRGLLWAWARDEWMGEPTWVAQVEILGREGKRWTAAGNVLPRDED